MLSPALKWHLRKELCSQVIVCDEVRARETAHSGKCLSPKHENLRLIPRTYAKDLGCMLGARNNSLPGTHWLANLTYWVSQVPTRDCVSKNKADEDGEVTQRAFAVLAEDRNQFLALPGSSQLSITSGDPAPYSGL